eukprot:1048064-Rhodomonas_salina.2
MAREGSWSWTTASTECRCALHVASSPCVAKDAIKLFSNRLRTSTLSKTQQLCCCLTDMPNAMPLAAPRQRRP